MIHAAVAEGKPGVNMSTVSLKAPDFGSAAKKVSDARQSVTKIKLKTKTALMDKLSKARKSVTSSGPANLNVSKSRTSLTSLSKKLSERTKVMEINYFGT